MKFVVGLFCIGLICAIFTGIWLERQVENVLFTMFSNRRWNVAPTVVAHPSVQSVRIDFTVDHAPRANILSGESIFNFGAPGAAYVMFRTAKGEQSFLLIGSHCYTQINDRWAETDSGDSAFCALLAQVQNLDDIFSLQGIAADLPKQATPALSREIIDARWVDKYHAAASGNLVVERLLSGHALLPFAAVIWLGTEDSLPYKVEYSVKVGQDIYLIDLRLYDYNMPMRITLP